MRTGIGLALTAAIILIVLIGLYIVVTPPKSTGTNTAPTTIEIIGGNTFTPDKPQGLDIAAANFGSLNTSVADSEFARNDDLARVNAYRDAERLARLSEPHLARAKEFLANGALIYLHRTQTPIASMQPSFEWTQAIKKPAWGWIAYLRR